MEARVALRRFHFSTWVDPHKVKRRPPSCSSRFSCRLKLEQRKPLVAAPHPPKPNQHHRHVTVEVSCSSGNFHDHFDEALVLKSQEISPYLNGRCIYLVGMMGSGKTTVGKVLSQALDNYSFADIDTLVEEACRKSVAEIFKLYGEGYFRDKETEALRKLSSKHSLVVSTGGGAVVRPVNWKCMLKGISVWLDVPLEALAQRFAAFGANSRPLLHHRETIMRLTSLFEERGDAYANGQCQC